MNIDRIKSQERILLRAQQRADAQAKRSQFNHELALSRIRFSAEMAVDRLNFQHDVILPRMEEIDGQLGGGVIKTRELEA
jgi:hypothetical protein